MGVALAATTGVAVRDFAGVRPEGQVSARRFGLPRI